MTGMISVSYAGAVPVPHTRTVSGTVSVSDVSVVRTVVVWIIPVAYARTVSGSVTVSDVSVVRAVVV